MIGGAVRIRDGAELPSNILWEVRVSSDGTKQIDLDSKAVFGVAAALRMATALRTAAGEIEAAATEAEALLYGKGGEA